MSNHEQKHSHPHEHRHASRNQSWWNRISAIFHIGHSHNPNDLASDQAFLKDEEGIRTVWLALAALTVTSILQIVIVLWSGSVALFADTVHNIGDGLNSIPLLIAFYLARRTVTRRYTYGFANAEDIAGIFIVLSIAFSAGLIFWESFQKLLHPQLLTNLGWVAAAAIVGFLGNEAVALLQIRFGRKIGSAALVADGLHARTDGLTSLAVLLAAAGSWLGFPILDPLIGIVIGIVILFVMRDATKTMWYRLMDAIDPELLAQAESVVQKQAGVREMRRIRMRWTGHRLFAEVTIAVDPHLTTFQSHQIAEMLRHDLFHAISNLAEVVVHVEPLEDELGSAHQLTAHHEPIPQLVRR